MKVLIVGAGIIGNFVAASLVSKGVSVELVDQREASFDGSSRAAFGSLTPFSDPFFKGEARVFAAKSVDMYRDYWVPELQAVSRMPLSFGDEGLLQLCSDKDDLDKYSDNVNSLRAAGYEARILSPDEVRKLEPALTGEFDAGIWMNEPWIDKDELFSSLTQYLSASPLCVQTFNTKVTSISPRAEADVSVGFESRDSAYFDFVVLCTGLTPTDELSQLPLLWIRGDCIGVITPTNRPLLRRHVYMHNGFITPRRSGYMLLGATYVVEEGPPADLFSGHRDQVQVAQVFELLSSNMRLLPAIKTCDFVRTWRGWRPTLQDELPVLGPSSLSSRILIANGFIGLGLTMAPAVGEAISGYIISGDSSGFPATFAPERLKRQLGAT